MGLYTKGRRKVVVLCLAFLDEVTMQQVLGFALSAVIVVVAFVVSATAAGMLADYIGWWKKPVIGSVAAACVVFAGYVSAPNYKLFSAAVWLLIGVVAAGIMSSVFMYAEDEGSSVPLYITYASGVFSLGMCAAWHKWRVQ